jgi:predicted nicotinamide N-methyase
MQDPLTRLRMLRAALVLGAGPAIAAIASASSPAGASETISYSYDARGRLIQVSHSGTVNNGVVTSYSHDHANNRTNKTTTGAP